MHTLNFTYRNSPIQVNFNFKAYKDFDEYRKKAEAMLEAPTTQEISLDAVPSDLLEITDDYGSTAKIHMNDICAVMAIDRDKDMQVQAELFIAFEKAKAKEGTKAMQDPAMRLMQPANRPIIPGTN